MGTDNRPTFKPVTAAFEQAIRDGRLSDRDAIREPYTPHAPYADEFMYMGTFNGVDEFKHIQTRHYLPETHEHKYLLCPVGYACECGDSMTGDELLVYQAAK